MFKTNIYDDEIKELNYKKHDQENFLKSFKIDNELYRQKT